MSDEGAAHLGGALRGSGYGLCQDEVDAGERSRAVVPVAPVSVQIAQRGATCGSRRDDTRRILEQQARQVAKPTQRRQTSQIDLLRACRLGMRRKRARSGDSCKALNAFHVPPADPTSASGRLRPLLLEWAAPAPSMMVLYPGRRHLSARVRAFADFVAEIYPAAGAWPEITAMVAGRTKSCR